MGIQVEYKNDRNNKVLKVLREATEPIGATEIARRIGEDWCMYRGKPHSGVIMPILRRIEKTGGDASMVVHRKANVVPLLWAGQMVEVGTLENEDGSNGSAIGFNLKLESGQVVTVTGLTKAQASMASMYLYKACEIRLSGVENAD